MASGRLYPQAIDVDEEYALLCAQLELLDLKLGASYNMRHVLGRFLNKRVRRTNVVMCVHLAISKMIERRGFKTCNASGCSAPVVWMTCPTCGGPYWKEWKCDEHTYGWRESEMYCAELPNATDQGGATES